MRMHKKGHLEERIAACGDIVTVADLSDKNMKRAALTPEYIAFSEIFGNGNPVCMEIGCGNRCGVFASKKGKASCKPPTLVQKQALGKRALPSLCDFITVRTVQS